MSSMEEDIGYIKAKTDSNTKAIEVLTVEMKAMRDELSLYKHFVVFMKALGLMIICVATLKFGDVIDIWKEAMK